MTDSGSKYESTAETEALGSPVAEQMDDYLPRELNRRQLAWKVIVFQFKLALDGLRDVVLSPVSIISGLLGLIEGGSDPARYFRRVIRWGRSTERWINLFGHHESDTADEFVRPLERRFYEEIDRASGPEPPTGRGPGAQSSSPASGTTEETSQRADASDR